jgi:hypothetical protein
MRARRLSASAACLISCATSWTGVTAASEPLTEAESRAIIAKYGGTRCLREGKRSGADLEPDAIPDAAPQAAVEYAATERSVFETCQALGCVEDPTSGNPHFGVCGPGRSAADCAGAAKPDARGFCGEPHIPLTSAGGLRAQRLMMTGTALAEFAIDLPDKDAGVDVAAGVLYQLALTRSDVARLPSGGQLHYNLPRWYLHAATFVSKQRAGHDVGIVHKFNSDVVTRVGAGFYGQAWGPIDLLNDTVYLAGPSLHLEFLSNLLVQGAFLPIDTGPGPQWMVALQYAAGLWEDFAK